MPAPRTAMIADDDRDTRELMHRVLSMFGFEVRSFDDGDALVHAALADPPTVIVTDQSMERCNGTVALGRIRTAGANCPTVLLTAFPGAELTEEAERLGSCVVVPKPLDLGRLRRALVTLGCLV